MATRTVRRIEIDTDSDYGRIAASEFIGTMLLMLGGPGVFLLGGATATTMALGIGVTLMVLMYLLGPTSGAHLNPAVSLGMFLAKRINLRWMLTSWVSQCAGAIAGFATIWGIARVRPDYVRGNFLANGYERYAEPFTFSSLGAVATIEIILAAVLVMAYLFAAHRRFAPSMVGVVVGGVMTMGWLLSMAIDGGSMNPARSLGAAIFAAPARGALGQLWAFIVFPLVGALVGVVAWLILDPARLEDTLLVEVPGAEAVRDTVDKVVD